MKYYNYEVCIELSPGTDATAETITSLVKLTLGRIGIIQPAASLNGAVLVDVYEPEPEVKVKSPRLVQGVISWEDAAAIADTYELVLAREAKGHELCIDKHGTLRWVADPVREQQIMDSFGAKDLNELFGNGADKNDPLVRELYKCMGYSLFGFWEVFYWTVNNEDANEYVAPEQ